MTSRFNEDNITMYEVMCGTRVVRAFKISRSTFIEGGYYSHDSESERGRVHFVAFDDEKEEPYKKRVGFLRLKTTDTYGKWVVVEVNPSKTITAFYDSITQLFKKDGTSISGRYLPDTNRCMFFYRNDLLLNTEDMLSLVSYLSLSMDYHNES